MASFHTASIWWACVPVLLWTGLRVSRRKSLSLGRVPLWALSFLLACVVTLGASFAQSGDSSALVKWMILPRMALYYLLFACVEGALSEKSEKEPLPRRVGWMYALCLLLSWTPWFVLLYPGVLSNDSITQMKMILGLEPMTNNNPVFQTWLLGACYQVGHGLLGSDNAAMLLYVLPQMALLAMTLAYALGVMRDLGAPRGLIGASFLLFALCIIFPLFALCVGKDTNFAAAVLLLSLCAARLIERDKPGKGLWALTLLSGVLVTLLRNPGFYLAALTLGGLLIWALRARRVETAKPAGWALAAATCAYLCLHLALLPALGIPDTSETENQSVPLQQVARIVSTYGDALTEEERAAVDAVLPVDEIRGAYQGELSDPIKDLVRPAATREQKAAFRRVWLELVRRYPATALSATFHNVYGYLTPGFVSGIKPTFLIGKQGHTDAIDARFQPSVSAYSDSMRALTDRLEAQPLTRLLLSPGGYALTLLFALVILLRKGNKRWLIPLLPALGSLAGCMGSAVCGYLRYSLPLIVCAPLALALCARALQDKGGLGQ